MPLKKYPVPSTALLQNAIVSPLLSRQGYIQTPTSLTLSSIRFILQTHLLSGRSYLSNPPKSFDTKAMAAQENSAVALLARRREVLAQTWGGIFEEDCVRLDNTAAAYRHCLLGAGSKLRELVEESQRERLRTVEFWEDKVRFDLTDWSIPPFSPSIILRLVP